MATSIITLKDGLKVGQDTLYEAELRDIIAGDVIEAQEESEKLVETAEGPRLVSSPTRMSLGILRRQIVRIGNVAGPISREELCRLSKRDLDALDAEARRLESATAQAMSAASGGGDAGSGR